MNLRKIVLLCLFGFVVAFAPAANASAVNSLRQGSPAALDGTRPVPPGGVVDGTSPVPHGGVFDGTRPVPHGGAFDATSPVPAGTVL